VPRVEYKWWIIIVVIGKRKLIGSSLNKKIYLIIREHIQVHMHRVGKRVTHCFLLLSIKRSEQKQDTMRKLITIENAFVVIVFLKAFDPYLETDSVM
jgi:hypothetical protein